MRRSMPPGPWDIAITLKSSRAASWKPPAERRTAGGCKEIWAADAPQTTARLAGWGLFDADTPQLVRPRRKGDGEETSPPDESKAARQKPGPASGGRAELFARPPTPSPA